MATSIYFGGRRTVVPQALSKLDTSLLSSVSPAAVGIVALVGTAEGGKPLSVEQEHSDHTGVGSVLTRYRSGDLRIASLFAFEPSLDEAIPGGAQRLVNVKVNPATQSTLTLPDAASADAVELTSRDWGLFTTQINVEVEPGTNQGKRITVVLEDDVEVFDDVGGEPAFDLLYAGDYDTAAATLTATTFVVAGSWSQPGLSAELTSSGPAGFPSAVEVTSSSASDTTQTVTIFGLVGTTPHRETVQLNGFGTVSTVRTDWTQIVATTKSAATVGTVTITDDSANTIATMSPAQLSRGAVVSTTMPAAGVLTGRIDADTAGATMTVFGRNTSGAQVAQYFDLATAATTPVVGTVAFAAIDVIALGDVTGARIASIDCNAVSVSLGVYRTISRLVDYLNGLGGMTATALSGDSATFLTANLDGASSVSIIGTAAEFTRDLQDFVDVLNAGSGLVSAARATGATAVPDDTGGALYLLGGTEGTTTISEWAEAFRLLRGRRVNTIVPLTRDPAVHALLATHLVERAGALRSEANGYIGIGTSGGAGETRANLTAQIRTLATRHLSAIAQECQRFDPDTGEETWFAPHFFAAIAAGMQAGSAIAEPLTRKVPFVNDIRQDPSWNPVDDAEDLIERGLMMAVKDDDAGIYWIRSVTTYLDDNPIFSEMSSNESANAAVYQLRTRLDRRTGGRGLASSVGAIRSLAAAQLDALVEAEIIVSWRGLQVEQIGDVFPVSVEIAPVEPINFIPITVHLVRTSSRAAA